MPKRQTYWRQGALVVFIVCFYLLIISNYINPLEHLSPTMLPSYLWAEDGLIKFSVDAELALPVTSTWVGASRGEELYGLVSEEDLPWSADPPLDLRDLRTRYKADRLIHAFRTTLPDPILQEEHNVTTAALYLAGTVIEPNTIFSLNSAIGPRTKARGFGAGPLYVNGQIGSTIGGGICKVATTMYNVVIHSDLQLIERHPHSMLVPYVPPGRDATILWGSKDLKFLNNKDHPIIIWATVRDKTLYIALYGQYDPPLVEWHSEELGRAATWTIRRKNPSLSKGEERFLAGAEGMSVRTWIQVHYPDLASSSLFLGIDYYRPLPNYLEYGP